MGGEVLLAIGMIATIIIIAILIKIIDIIGNFFIKIFIAITNSKLHIDAIYKDLNTINREIDVEYSPAVASYIYNVKLEPKKDILATILNLYNKGVITIEKDEAGYKFIPRNSAKIVNLTSDEKYIYYCFIENPGKLRVFSAKAWKEIVKEEAERYDYYRTYRFQINEHIPENIVWYRSLIIDAIIVLLIRLIFIKELTGMVFVDWGIPILIIILAWIPVDLIYLVFHERIMNIKKLLRGITKNGKEEIKKWMKFKKFIKDYTLIEERKIEEVVIYEKYIPYAMALGINKEYNDKKIKEFVDNYMKLSDKSVEKYLYTNLFEESNN